MVSVLFSTDAKPPLSLADESAIKLPAILPTLAEINIAPPEPLEFEREIKEPGSKVTLLPAKAAIAPPFTQQLALMMELPFTSATSLPVAKIAPPAPAEVFTNELLLRSSALPPFTATAPPFEGLFPFASVSRWSLTRAPLSSFMTALRCCASRTAPSPPDDICSSTARTMMGEPPRLNTCPGGKKSASALLDGAASIAARSCAIVATVVKPTGPGMSGGIGGGAGGVGDAGGAAGTTSQPCTLIPASRHAAGHSWLITALSAADGANATGQPAAIATYRKSATLPRHASPQAPKSPAAAAIPCVHSVPPVQMAIEVNVSGTSEHGPPLPPVLEECWPPVGATLWLDAFVVTTAASCRKCTVAVPVGAKGTSTLRTPRSSVNVASEGCLPAPSAGC
eukprot:5134545-Prymnesium_polylepis.1